MKKVKLSKITLLVIFILIFIGATIFNNEASKPAADNNTNIETKRDTGKLVVHFIDVGQADSILLVQGEHAMLIDAGNNDDSELVYNYIKTQHINKLEYVIGTHPHEDHIGGLDYIINNFQIGKVYLPRNAKSTTKTYTDVLTAIKEKGLKINNAVPQESFSLGDAQCTILAPNNSKYEDLNNYSIVIKVKFNSNTFLFEGDAEAISEMEMVKKGYDIKADVLKIGHHGSNSSTCANFLAKVKPEYAVISLGNNNDYGHPQKKTMDRLKNSEVPVYRTDESGTIVAVSDGENINFNVKPGDYKTGNVQN